MIKSIKWRTTLKAPGETKNTVATVNKFTTKEKNVIKKIFGKTL